MECDRSMDNKTMQSASEDHNLQWNQWQLLDSILPTGGFAHSYGLEAAVQTRLVSDPDTLETHITHILENTGSLLLPYVYKATISPNMETWFELDRTLNATLTNEKSRRASIAQGSALLRVGASVFTEIPFLKNMRELALKSDKIKVHHAPVFGVICGVLGFGHGFSQRAYMFLTLRDMISASTRLNLVGPMGGAALHHRVAKSAEGLVKRWMDRPVEEACQTGPLLDVVQGCHGYLFTRLFCS
ncbi:urease accessory protein F [Amborella trichopoda]|nr:urease accessory protein F [Amborella trichopoda]XP_020528309.1 urease accessory protein F [Amborella trichopoda]XP_020528310.1 urease accessory protein F [Amborella trichopoda]XP_020528311.1 urease accessory protein F [Amborella trichopoda]XP_020528312.1 urease accessory protein F [Amborella trichopoda]XP_020528313.1 urease accessory protein F [Amborella trichopoda]|eukprot:XP_006853123.2 urease accessory protein F [Amborella trichopoda]